eukprot:399237-Pleurochrysis_carterae.AAC.1
MQFESRGEIIRESLRLEASAVCGTTWRPLDFELMLGEGPETALHASSYSEDEVGSSTEKIQLNERSWHGSDHTTSGSSIHYDDFLDGIFPDDRLGR